MKKIFLSLFVLGLSLNLSATEDLSQNIRSFENKPLIRKPKAAKAPQATLTRADGENLFGYCFDLYSPIGARVSGAVLEGVIEIPAQLAQQWKGSQVTGVSIGFGQSTNKNVNIYITKDLEGETVLMQNGTITKERDWNYVKFNTPYTIDGETIYIGYQSYITNNEKDFPIVFDGVISSLEYSSIMGISYMDESGQMQSGYFTAGDLYGSVCLKVEISGGNMPQFGGMINTVFPAELAAVNQPFEMAFSFVNTGLSSISGAEAICKVNGEVIDNIKVSVLGEASSTPDANDIIPFGTTGFIVIDNIVAKESGNASIEVTVNKLKGTGGEASADFTVKANTLIANKLYEKNIVVEEFTGTWCGFCPRGIVGMKYMEENYGDDFIGIAIHWGNGDPMETPTYAPYGEYYFYEGGYPNATLNRTYDFDPNKETLEEYYLQAKEVGSPVTISLKANYDEASNKLTATATGEFSFDSTNPPYAIAFVITENNVGPYVQTNNFAGGLNGGLEGWSEKGKSVPWLYDEVARGIWDLFGIKGSVPTKVTAFTPFEFSQELPLDNVKDINQCTVVAMLLNTETGEIVNADKVSLKGAGVESITTEPVDGIYKVYNPQGTKVLETKNADEIKNLSSGIYIINGKKVFVK